MSIFSFFFDFILLENRETNTTVLRDEVTSLLSDERRGVFEHAAGQLVSRGDGLHASLLPYRIDAFTLSARGDGKTAPVAAGSASHVIEVMRGCELWLRTMSNLIERLHHATYQYLLVSRARFVTMTKYFPALALMLAGPALYLLNFIKQAKTGAVESEQLLPTLQLMCVFVSWGVLAWLVRLSWNPRPGRVLALDLALLATVLLLVVFSKLKLFKQVEFLPEKGSGVVTVLFAVYAVFGQFWMPLCFNFAVGLVAMAMTVSLLLLFVLNNALWNRWLQLVLWLVWPFVWYFNVFVQLLNDDALYYLMVTPEHPLALIYWVVIMPIYGMSLLFIWQRFDSKVQKIKAD